MHPKISTLVGDKRLSYFKVNDSLPPTQEQADEQEYIRNTIMDSDYRCGVVNMKTGRGKTHIIFWLIEHFRCSTLILCHNIKQAHETYEKLKAYSNINESDIAILTSKSKETATRLVTVTTHTGFVKKYTETYQGKFQQIIYDECDYNLSFPVRQEFD